MANPKVVLNTGTRFIINELLKWFSLLFKTDLLYPPNYISIRLTRRCNLRCLQCECWRIKNASEFSTNQWKDVILDIKSYIGPYFLRFYGGEPFLRSDLLELIRFCFCNDITTFITTNGTLINKSVADELAKNDVAQISISLDGFKEKTHDRLRGAEGTYRKVMQAIENLRGKVDLQINTTIMRDNLDEILDLTDFAIKNKLKISFQGYNNKIYRKYDSEKKKSDGSVLEDQDWFNHCDLKKLDYVVDRLTEMKKYNKVIIDPCNHFKRLKLYYHRSSKLKKMYCEAIGRQLMIKDKGDITLCSFCSFPIGSIGNISKNSFKDVWTSKEAAAKKNKMLRCKETDCLVIRGCYKEGYFEKIAKIKNYFFGSGPS
ncbi:MAG: radical SAM protein [Candidatus Omnitrophica bacterium]|nr:radical SAM protein [Candidatus Omnitrophota bacterium]MCF7891960.1 radical SAM protein [Candidatus Omnitrophota bacterium]MCF7895478.1 radical SAM protein [Candidatus Omnitrophota bacterium]MCF7898009.1 radical SAM protein [Candidatus Omnitrophota bacterium]MCF7909637.1 radical SAM protein [Candidatus Omnitrophota bacterium]